MGISHFFEPIVEEAFFNHGTDKEKFLLNRKVIGSWMPMANDLIVL